GLPPLRPRPLGGDDRPRLRPRTRSPLHAAAHPGPRTRSSRTQAAAAAGARACMINADEATTVLFRPVGEKELELIRRSGRRAFPPRLPGQPLFYPVLNEAYAAQIARDWNTKDPASGFAGYVTRFSVRKRFLDRYTVRTVGGGIHQEYWIPADELEEFN